jgi:hypothetical protein
MKTEITSQIVYVVIKQKNKVKTTKAIKHQIFVLRPDNVKDHLIGSVYHDILTNKVLDVKEEKGVCKTMPMILTKFTFKHEAPRKTHKQSSFK